MMSHPWSFSQRIATEVSSPPEYASTSFLAGIGEELFEGSACAGFAEHGDDRVVAGHRAGDAGQRSLIDSARHQVGGAGRSTDHRHRRADLDREEKHTEESYR